MQTVVNWQPQNLANDLVTLKPLEHADFEGLYAVASDKLIWEQHPAFDRYKKVVFERFFARAIESKSSFLILDTVTYEIIGSTRFYDYDSKNRTVAIGYTFLARKYWGTSLNKSLKTMMINHAFKQGIENLIFHIGINNLRSQKAVEKLGAVKIKEFAKEDKGLETYHVEFVVNHLDWNKQ